MVYPAELYDTALLTLPFELLDKQSALLTRLCAFACLHAEREAFIVRGYAGTGKTSLLGALVKAMKGKGMKCVLLSPTGRAAKVFSRYAGTPAYTIHKRIYRGNSSDPSNPNFYLAPNRDKNTLFIVDEASMIPGLQSPLLKHLIMHVNSAPGCALVFVGDTAQLPPVGEQESFAMEPEHLQELGLTVDCFELDKPLRQAARSGILYNATRLRKLMKHVPLPEPRLWVERFADVEVVSGEFLAEQVADSYSEAGTDDTIIITRSNFRAGIYNRGIRGQVLYAESELQRGERLVVAKNNYFWTRGIKGTDFIANGEAVTVSRILGTEECYGQRFARVELQLSDAGIELEALIFLNTLGSDTAALSQEEQQDLFSTIMQEKMSAGMTYSQALYALNRDPYFNALQTKYAYCLTCHKAQGGQWKHVFIDLAGIDISAADLEFYRWLYTAVTRASERLFLINPSVPLL